jgi:hypothetical protein
MMGVSDGPELYMDQYGGQGRIMERLLVKSDCIETSADVGSADRRLLSIEVR